MVDIGTIRTKDYRWNVLPTNYRNRLIRFTSSLRLGYFSTFPQQAKYFVVMCRHRLQRED